MNTLQPRSSFRSIVIRYQKYRGHDWQHNGEAKEIIRYPKGPKGRPPDHDIVFMPFCVVQNVRHTSVEPSSQEMDDIVDWGFINYGQDFIVQNGFKGWNTESRFRDDPEYTDLVRVFDNVKSLIMDTKFFLDTKLDRIPGIRAEQLRLARYATWFKGGNKSQNSPYQDYIRTVLRCYPESVKTHDPDLQGLATRFKWLVKLYRHICLQRPQPASCLEQQNAV